MNNKKMPLVSVAIPSFNHQEFVQECIQSVIDQDYKNIELIIIDDGSEDNSIEKITKMIPACQSRFKNFEFRSRPNKGLCATLNEAIEWCSGEYFMPFASDDILIQDKISFQVEIFSRYISEGIAGIFGDLEIISTEVQRNKKLTYNKNNKNKIYDFNDVFFRKSKLLAPSALLLLSKVKSIKYNEKYLIEDFYMWLKITESGGKLLYTNRCVALYRRHTGNFSKQREKMLHGINLILKEYNNHPKYKIALASSYLVTAGDAAEDRDADAFELLIKGLIIYPQLLFSKKFALFFYKLLKFSKK